MKHLILILSLFVFQANGSGFADFFDKAQEKEQRKAQVMISQQFPVSVSSETFPFQVSFYRARKLGFALSYQVDEDNVPFSNKLENFNPKLFAGLTYDFDGNKGAYVGGDILFKADQRFFYGAKLYATLTNQNIHSYAYVGYNIPDDLLIKSAQAVLYASVYTGKINILDINLDELKERSQNILKNENLILGAYINPDVSEKRLAFSFEVKGFRQVLMTMYIGGL